MPAPIVAAAAGAAARAAGTRVAARAIARAGTTAPRNAPKNLGRRYTARRMESEFAEEQLRRARMDEREQIDEGEKRIQQALAAIAGHFKEKGFDFDSKDLDEVGETKREEPTFPAIIFSLALAKDIFDTLDLTIVGIVLTTLFTIFFTMVMVFWMFGKMKGAWWKKILITWFWKRFLFVFIIEMLPWFKIIPTNVIIVLMVHFREKKMVKALNVALEILHSFDIHKLKSVRGA